MCESIIIKNFGPVVSAEMHDIQKFTVIIGTSGSGKSTVMKLLSLSRWLYKMLNIRAYLQESGLKKSPFRLNIKACLQDDGLLDYLKEETFIEYRNAEACFTISGKNGEFKQVSKVHGGNLCLEKVVFITEKRNMIPDLLASRMKEKDAPFYVRQLLEEFRAASVEIKSLSLHAVDVKLSSQKVNGIEQWFIGDKESNSNFRIHLEDSSSGIQSLAPLNMLVDYYAHHFNLVKSLNNAVLKYLADNDSLKYFKPNEDIGDIKRKHIDIHIEEPEICLYPDNQLHLLNYIVKEVHHRDNDYDLSLIFTTHSPYMLNQLNLLFKAYDMGKEIEGASLNYLHTNVYVMEDGILKDIEVKNAHLVNPEYLSQPLDEIYNQYEALKEGRDAEQIDAK